MKDDSTKYLTVIKEFNNRKSKVNQGIRDKDNKTTTNKDSIKMQSSDAQT